MQTDDGFLFSREKSCHIFLLHSASLTFTLLLALENWPRAIAKRKSGPKRPIQKRLNLSRNGWYHLSFGEPTFGYTDTQQQRKIVRQKDHKISMLPRSAGDAIQPWSRTYVVLPIWSCCNFLEMNLVVSSIQVKIEIKKISIELQWQHTETGIPYNDIQKDVGSAFFSASVQAIFEQRLLKRKGPVHSASAS